MIKCLPKVNFQIRVRDDSIGGDNPFKWETKSTEDFFGKKRLLFSRYQVPLLRHARLINYLTLTNFMKSLNRLE